MRKTWLFLLVPCLVFGGCSEKQESAVTSSPEGSGKTETAVPISIPDTLADIPAAYFSACSQAGTLEDLSYDTWESFSYQEHSHPLTKHAVVYLPYGYDETERYPIFYLMHGGWSDENTLLGTPSAPSSFKNVLDHAIAQGEMEPLIVVCPTYNNTNENGRDSDDFSLALQLTDNFHNELLNDLMPAVEGTYSTYAETLTPEGFAASRDHRGFGGFSMGSVATWHTFQYGLDFFRFFMPMSCGTSLDDAEIWQGPQGHAPQEYFVFMMTGTRDFAYSFEQERSAAMAASPWFTSVDEDASGNFAYRVQEGSRHDGQAAMTYTWNGLKAFFPGK